MPPASLFPMATSNRSESSVSPATAVSASEDTAAEKTQKVSFKACPRKIRYNAALLVLVTIGLAQLVAHLLPSSIAGIVIFVLGIFAHEFNAVHGPAMTRHLRAYFDVANVLETYQPRNRTMGHLFQPEPPTPGNVTFDPKTDDHDAKNADAAFTNARDSHYANMYEHAMKMAKEMEGIEKAAALPSLDAGSDQPLKPADPVADKKANDEKKAKELEDYKKQLEKPFSC